MNVIRLLLPLIFVLATYSCKHKSFSITGSLDTTEERMVYLKKYDHFNYLDNSFILDSCLTDFNGNFSFEINKDYPKLVTLSTHKVKPGTYQVFEKSPQIFYYSMCEKFLASTPTFYIEPQRDYKISHWDDKLEMRSVVFEDVNSNRLREYYKTVDFRKDLRDENRKRVEVSKEEALRTVMAYRDYFLDKYDLNRSFPENSFEHYFKTEIYLGALNEFLQWYSFETERDLNDNFYSDLMANYQKEVWHPSSLEYYKFNEHFVTYLMNIGEQSTEKYFPPSNKKLDIARKSVNENIKDIYLNNLKQLNSK